eukprot:6459979-Amphidinium_carterae.2
MPPTHDRPMSQLPWQAGLPAFCSHAAEAPLETEARCNCSDLTFEFGIGWQIGRIETIHSVWVDTFWGAPLVR